MVTKPSLSWWNGKTRRSLCQIPLKVVISLATRNIVYYICFSLPLSVYQIAVFQGDAYEYSVCIYLLPNFHCNLADSKGKSVPLQARRGTEGSRKLRFPNFVTMAQDGGKVVSLTYRPPLPPGNAHGTHFCWRLSRSQGHSAIGRILRQWKIQWHHLGSNQRRSYL